ncbi:hypothetical protein AK812_SmicGene385 [Symbiodinium microadriaticum]|uniref:Uncharacterized protein n=1 Tax=Symbiodinium microadriaticum TaxID=2951 RepID=A0A1Q9F6P8_SYMMI|nr:hypothetical protein AK812_SmicGene385 [Symbiodinium microadriaticum]
MFDQAQRQNQSHLLPKRLRHYISDAWFKWRLLWRMDSLDMSTSTVDINRSVDDLVQDIWEVLDTAFTSAAIAGAREAQMRCDVIMLDGNAKNRRTVCAAALAATSRCHMLGKVLRHNCPCTPKLGSQFCAQHNLSKAQDDADMKILNHRLPNSEQPELLLHVRELHGANREAWVAEKIVPDHVLAAYWRELGEGKLAQAAMRRDKKRQKRHAGSALATSSSSSLRSFADSTSLQLDSASNDLLAVSCSTHKETESCQRELAKTAGVLCVCLSSGLILMLREIFGSESLSQRYLCLSALKAALPECTTVVHDDACHLYKYSERRMGESAHAAALAPPALRFVCDAFHMAGHVDPWCRSVCDPRSAENSTVLEGVRTSACEFTFTWLSAYKHQTKHMNQFGFRFFLLELAWSHNRVILNGGYGFPDSSSNFCGDMPSQDVERQYLPAMKLMWEEVDRLFDPVRILGRTGHHLAQTYCTRAAHAEFPYTMHLLSMMCPLSNGARVAVFPTSPSPLVAFCVNVNYAQTRKSSMTAHADGITRELDLAIQQQVTERVSQEPDESHESLEEHPDGIPHARAPRPPPHPRLRSVTISRATPEEWFNRCAGDYQQILNAAKLPGGIGKWGGRQWFGVLGNLDEAYDFLTSFGLASEDGKQDAKKHSKLNPHQSALNKLLQFGTAARATKTAGSYGEGASQTRTISLGVTCNMHPTQYIPMERCELGSHQVAAKERFLISSGRPVQPHQDLPDD